jgi:hypothetical protein
MSTRSRANPCGCNLADCVACNEWNGSEWERVERKIHFYSEKRRNEMLSYAAGDMAEAYLIGAEEAQGEFLARLQAIRRTFKPPSQANTGEKHGV